MTALNPLSGQQYLNLETFRRSGVGMKTPVWFVQDGDILVRTHHRQLRQSQAHPQQRAGEHCAVQSGWCLTGRVDPGQRPRSE